MNKLRISLLACFIIPLLISELIDNEIMSLILGITGCLSALIFLWIYLPQMTRLPSEHPKLKSIRQVTIFNIILIFILAFIAYLSMQDKLSQQNEEMFMIILLIVLLIVFGNVAPKIPFNRHTGLRLPWTVMDEETWIVAHRILGYISIPLIFLFLLGLRCGIAVPAMFVGIIMIWILVPGILSLLFYIRKYRSY